MQDLEILPEVAEGITHYAPNGKFIKKRKAHNVYGNSMYVAIWKTYKNATNLLVGILYTACQSQTKFTICPKMENLPKSDKLTEIVAIEYLLLVNGPEQPTCRPDYLKAYYPRQKVYIRK